MTYFAFLSTLFILTVLTAAITAMAVAAYYFRPHRQCLAVVSWERRDGALKQARCVLNSRHGGECAATLSSLEEVGYAQTPF